MPVARRSNAGRSSRSNLPAPAIRSHDGAQEPKRRRKAMIRVTGSVTAREDSFSEVSKLSLEHVRRSRLEPGCISHAVHVDCENPLRLGVIQKKGDPGALAGPFPLPPPRA